MPTRPFPVDARLTAVALAYRNPDTTLIADDVLPRTPASAEFKWLSYAQEQAYTVPDTKVGRKSEPNVVEFAGSEVVDRVVDYGLDDLVPNEDINDDNQGVDPLGQAVEFTTALVRLARERRAANLVFNAATYPSGFKTTLSGTSQWSDYTNSNPLSAIMSALDTPLVRPNVAVFGQAVWTVLRQHPRMVQAVYGTSQSAGVITRQQLADLLEVQAVYVGAGFANTAKRGQAANMQRMWGKHAAFLYRDRLAGPQGGVTFGFTAEAQALFAGLMDEPAMGLQGSVRVRVGERVKEVVSAPNMGYFFENAVA